jgi:hypothetical protein
MIAKMNHDTLNTPAIIRKLYQAVCNDCWTAIITRDALYLPVDETDWFARFDAVDEPETDDATDARLDREWVF